MKKSNPLILVLATLLTFVLLWATPVRAQTNAYDDALHYTKQTWITNGLSFGFGFVPWVLTTNGPTTSSHGFFTTHNGNVTPFPTIASPTNSSSAPGNDGSAHVWGLFANGTGLNSAVAYRGFSNSLDTTVVFKVQWQTDGIGNQNTNLGGFVLRNGNATNGTADLRTNQRFSFYYVGGGSNSFVIWDGSGVTSIGVPFTSAAFTCEFTLEAGDTYRFVLKNPTNDALIFLTDSQPLTGSGTIDSIALFAQQTSANQEFNRMQIVSASLIPPTIVNIQPTNGSIYVDAASSKVSFEVDSLASTIASNNVSLVLNGVTQSNLVFNTAGATNQLFVTNNGALSGNLVYNGTIIATDGNGNRTTNTVSFNTFRADNPFIEAEDYNFNSGGFIANSFPDPYGAYANLFGTNGVDYLEIDLTVTNLYRPGDLPQIQAATDQDHAGYAGGGYTDYNLGYTQNGEWQNYTRVMSNVNYTVYARMAGFAGNAVMQVEHLANATATSSNQPAAALGTCVCPHTGGSQTYTLVPLTDFFSNPVQIRFVNTNTFRCRVVGDNASYNLSYLTFVPNTNTATLTPYLTAGYPYPNAAGVALDTGISFTIANRATAVNPATIQVRLDSNDITGSITISNNAAGAVVSYAPPAFLAPNSNHVITAIFTDNGGPTVTMTNTWTFTTVNATLVTIPAADAQPIGSGANPGFALRIYKVEDAAPTTSTLANAEAELSGTRTNTVTSQPYPNLANGGPNADGSYAETNVINYDINAQSTGSFPGDTAFPYVPANAINNNIALQALMYLQLSNGNYRFEVRSDDGFKLTAGPTPGDTNLVLGLFDGGRGNGTASDIYFTVLTNGLYPMRLLYFQAGSGGNVEFYSVKNGTAVLINDPTNSNSIKSFQSLASAASPVTILNPARTGNSATFNFVTQSGHSHFVEYKISLTDPSWTLLSTIAGNGSTTNITDTAATNGTRFYRVRSQ